MSDLENFARRGRAAQHAVDKLTSTKLRLDRDGSGKRHFVGDVPLHCGDPLAAEINGTWYDGRYEATWRGGNPIAFFYFVDALQNEHCSRIDEATSVRLSEERA